MILQRAGIILIAFIMSFTGLSSEYLYPLEHLDLPSGNRIAYVKTGKMGSPQLLCIHGLGGNIKYWYPQLRQFENDFQTYALDLPGYGASYIKKIPESRLLDDFAEDLAEFGNRLHLEDVILVGHSMGAHIAMKLALKKPDWLNSLVLLAPAGFETFSQAEVNWLKQATSEEVFFDQNEATIRKSFALNFNNQPDWIEELIQDRLTLKATESYRTLCKLKSAGIMAMVNDNIAEKLTQIHQDTLIIFGGKDKLIPHSYLHPGMTLKQVAAVGNQIPNSRLVWIPGAGHMVQAEKPERVCEEIRKFINEQKLM